MIQVTLVACDQVMASHQCLSVTSQWKYFPNSLCYETFLMSLMPMLCKTLFRYLCILCY